MLVRKQKDNIMDEMLLRKTIVMERKARFFEKVADYSQLTKFRLSFLVVLSSLIAFLYAGSVYTTLWKGILLCLGGFLVTGSANAINQLLEKSLDKLMDRTKNRPLASSRMNNLEAMLAAGTMGVTGLYFLFLINPITSALGGMALLLYSFVYTPMKQVSSFSVFIGAIPGALSPVLGWTAATGTLSYEAWVFFIIQFTWQFPHFWAIAWVMAEDYAKAGFYLLPSPIGRNKTSALWILVSTVILIPISLIPYYLNMGGIFLFSISLLASLVFLWFGIQLYRRGTVQAAYHLMFGSFFYLPVVQLALLANKLF